MKARDEATNKLKLVKKDLRALDRQITGAGTVWKKYQRQIAVGGAAVAAVTGKMGKDWQDSKRSIVDATGASGKALDGLMQSYRGVQGTVAASNAQISKAIGDLNTHTKRAGPGLEQLATKALKAGLNTDTLGKSIKSFNVTGGEQERLIDKLVTLGQSYGANINQLQTDIGRYKGDLDALGLSMDQQITLAALAQSENQKLRNVVRELEDGTGGWREKLAQAVPALSGVAGATERAYEDGKTWGQSLTELRGKLEGMVGPMSQVAAGAGGLVSGFAAAATAFPGMAGRIVSALKLVTTGSRTMWLSLTGVGLLAAAGAAMWGFRDKVASLLASLIEMVGNGINRLLAIAHGMAEKLGLDSLADGILRAANAVSQGTSDATKALRTYARSFEDEAIPAAREYAGILGSGATGGNSASVTGALRATTEETRQAVTETEKLTRSFQNVAPAVGDWNTAISRSVMLIESRPLLLLRSDINSTQLASQALAVSLGKTNKVVAATGPTWGDTLRSGLASTWTVENVSQTIMGAFQGGGGLLGGIQALGTQMGGTLAQSLQSKLSGLTSNMGGVLGNVLNGALGMALPVIGPMLGKLAGKVAGAIGKGFKKLFGGPSKEVKDARSMHEKLAQDIELTHTGSHDRLQHFLSAGWKDANAKVATFFQDQLVRSGRNYDDWEGHWLRYQKAMEDGNDDLMRQLLKQATDWATTTETTSTAATTAVTNHAKASGAELDKIAAHVKTTMNAGDAALEHSKATATRAFDAMRRDADVLSRQWDETFRPRTVTHSVIIEKVETHRQAQAARVGDGGSSVSHGGPEQVSYGGERATGGPVQAGRGYVVGERGPEYFIPRHSGYIAPSSQPSPYRGPEKQTINVHLDGKVLMKHVVKNLPRQLDIRGFSR